MSEYALDHVCHKHGCANLALNPKLHRYDDCFPGKIALGDIDGSVELNGHILWVEWKHKAILEGEEFENVHKAQWIQAKAFTRNSGKQTFVFVVGPLALPDTWAWRRVSRGGWAHDWNRTGEAGLMDMFRRWSAWAQKSGRAA